jgi:hypothetical protein
MKKPFCENRRALFFEVTENNNHYSRSKGQGIIYDTIAVPFSQSHA